jgi:aldose 1-epimerase
MKNIFSVAVIAAMILVSCGKQAKQSANQTEPALPVAENFTKSVDGKEYALYSLKNEAGMEIYVTNFGARIVSIIVPAKDGAKYDVALGFDDLDGYLNNKSDFGAAIGRYGNRIAKGQFTLDGKKYQLPLNNGVNSLHGGPTGFQYQYFDIEQTDAQTLVCTYLSPDGDNGYPGNLAVKVTYKLAAENALEIAYEAETDKATVLNLTNHSYFNLSGNAENTILDHVLYLNADRTTPVDFTLIPTGEIAQVAGTPFDFTTPTAIGERIDADNEQIKFGMGYDHNFIFADGNTFETLAGKVVSPSNGIVMEIYTTEPAVQFYTGNFLDGTVFGKNGIGYQKRTGFCLETQHYPDSPNHPNFPSTTLRPGEKFESKTIYKFSVE